MEFRFHRFTAFKPGKSGDMLNLENANAGKGGKRNGRPVTAVTAAILKLAIGESVLFPGIDIEHARYSTKTVRRSGYAIRFRSRSNGVRAERLA